MPVECKEINNLNNFVKGWYIDDLSLCDKIINYFESSPNKNPGLCGPEVNLNFKASTDCKLSDENLLTEYISELQKCVNKYIDLYPAVNGYSPWTITQDINIQRYKPSEAFHGWHTERTGTDHVEM